MAKTQIRRRWHSTREFTHDFKFEAPDGKKRAADALDSQCVEIVAKHYPNNRAIAFLDWFTYSDNTILVAARDVGTVKALQQIHAYIFGGLYDFAGKIRNKTISKGNTIFCLAEYLHQNLATIERMPETTFDEIVDKYVEMNVAHSFMEGNGRSTRIWLDMIFKKRLGLCVDWSKIDKREYLDAMIESHTNSDRTRALLKQAMTDKIDDREIFMKGIDIHITTNKKTNRTMWQRQTKSVWDRHLATNSVMLIEKIHLL